MTAGPFVLSIHALAVEGGDGVVGDAAVLSELGCRPLCAATSVLSTPSEGAPALQPMPQNLVDLQVAAALAAGRPAAIRIGALPSPRHVERLAEMLAAEAGGSIVLAPLVQIDGTRLLDDKTWNAARRALFPLARAVLVRATDGAVLHGNEVASIDDLRAAAAALREQGARAAVVAGLSQRQRMIDLVDDGGSVAILDAGRLQAPHVRGLSGAHAAAFAAHLARGATVARAAESAQRYVALRLLRARSEG